MKQLTWLPSIEPPFSFASVETDAEAYLQSRAAIRHVPEDFVLVQELTISQGLLRINSGLAVCEFNHEELGYVPFLFLAKNKLVFGALTQGAPVNFRVRALTPVEFYQTANSDFVEAYQTWPKLAQLHTVKLLRSSSALWQGHARAVNMPLELRLAYLFWDLTQPDDPHYLSARNFPFFIGQSLLGKYFGVPREEIGRKLKILLQKELIAKHERGLCLQAALGPELAKYGAFLAEPISGSDLYLTDIGPQSDTLGFGATRPAGL